MPQSAPPDSPQPSAHRFFFALKPDENLAARMHAFALAECGAKGLLNRAHLHVTLALTEDVPTAEADLIDALRRAGDRVRVQAFPLRLDRLLATRHTVSLRPSAASRPLEALQTAISNAIAAEGVAMRPDWPFDPHQTLAYRKGEPASHKVTPFDWAVDAFMLVHSHVGLHRHETIGRWSLEPPKRVD